MTSFDFIEARWMFLNNAWTVYNCTYNVIIGQRFLWIGYNDDQILLPRGLLKDIRQCSNWLKLDLIYIFGQVPVGRKPIINGGAIRPTMPLLDGRSLPIVIFFDCSSSWKWCTDTIHWRLHYIHPSYLIIICISFSAVTDSHCKKVT